MTAVFFRNPRLSTITLLRVSMAALMMLLSCKPSVPTWMFPIFEDHSALYLSYGEHGVNLDGDVTEQSRPDFDGCLHGRTRFYREQEPGFNLTYCSPALDESFKAYLESIFRPSMTAYPSFQNSEVNAMVLSPAALRDKLGPARLLYCEPDCIDGLQLLETDRKIISPAFAYRISGGHLPRRFYTNDFSLAITDHIWLLYRLPVPSRILAISLGTPTQIHELYAFLTEEALSRAAAIFSSAKTDAFVSGAYSGATGGAGNEQLILSSGADPVKQRVRIQGRIYDFLLFPQSSILLKRDHPLGFRFQSEPELEIEREGEFITLSEHEFQPAVAVPDRVALRESMDTSFSPSGVCLWHEPCSPRDIHNSLAKSIDDDFISQVALAECTVSDIKVTEFNPFGIILNSGDSLQTGGKFIELQLHRACANRSLYLKQEDLVVGLPDELEAGLLLLTADRSYFEVDSHERTLLRRWKAATILIGDSSESISTWLDGEARWVYGSRNDLPDLRRVHSFNRGLSIFHFHGTQCSGLRRDLCPFHAMTPGEAVQTEPSYPIVRLSEVLPYLNDRFVELSCNSCNGEDGRIDMLIRRTSDGREDHYVLPIPASSVVTITPNTVCGSTGIRFSDLYLPASASQYSVGHYTSTASGTSFVETDRWTIPTTLYNAIRDERRSAEPGETGPQPSNAPIPAGCEIHSSPGSSDLTGHDSGGQF